MFFKKAFKAFIECFVLFNKIIYEENMFVHYKHKHTFIKHV